MTKPQLAQLPATRQITVVIGTSVRKPAAVLRFYLAALAAQELPPNVVLKPVFIADAMAPDALEELRKFCAERNGEIIGGMPVQGPDFTDEHPDSHQWSGSAMARVGAHKDRVIQRTRELDADFLWFCDADLICDRTTLASMMAVGQPIVSAVYWTRWSQRGTETRKVHAAPQVWLRHPYELSGQGFSEAEFRTKLAHRQLMQVPGYGACTLISRQALAAGVSFAYVPGVSQAGLMAGEDRHFCLRAQALHQAAWADAWPDIFHIYHLPADLAKAPEFAERLNAPHAERASFGDLVNLTLQPIEPLPWAGGGWTAVPPQHIRGRLGALPLMPEIEEVIYDLKRGEARVIPVHFPVSHEVAYYAGKRRLIRVTLNDAKPHGFAPTLEDEMLIGAKSRGALRTVDYTTRQLNAMKEAAGG